MREELIEYLKSIPGHEMVRGKYYINNKDYDFIIPNKKEYIRMLKVVYGLTFTLLKGKYVATFIELDEDGNFTTYLHETFLIYLR